MDHAAQILFGKARSLVLQEFFVHAASHPGGDASLHLREIARRTGVSPSAVQYELRQLVQAGLITMAGTQARPRYSANIASPLYRELRALLRKTARHASARPIEDDEVWAAKRVRQREDYRSSEPGRKSPFFLDRGNIRAAKLTLKDRVVLKY